MITKERLKELIEQEATVYDPDTLWQSVGEVKLNKSMKINNGRLDGDLGDLGLKGAVCSCYIPLEYLFEKKEDAEFIAKYHTQRVVKFNPPTWAIFSEEETDIVFDMKDGRMMLSHWIIGDNHIVLIKTSKDDDFVFSEPLTKENYIKAVEYARKLFLGEEDESIYNKTR